MVANVSEEPVANTLNMKAAGFSEMLIMSYRTTEYTSSNLIVHVTFLILFFQPPWFSRNPFDNAR
jgi:hypothetical protein